MDTPLLRDPSDPRYVISFDVDDAAAGAHFSDWGFVVFRDVFTPAECSETRDAMWSVIEEGNPGFLRDDPLTWDGFKAAGKYGLCSRGAVFHPTLVKNRQNENLCRALSTCLQIPEDDVIVSHDRFTIYRATRLDQTVFGDCSRFRTGRRNVHLDLNPWWWLESSRDILVGADSLQYADAQDFIKENNLVVKSMGPHVQCVLNFADNLDEDGGTLVVPRFHKELKDWATTNAKLRKPVPFVTFGSKIIEQECESSLLSRAKRVAMRQGSVLVWTQTLMHGTEPNDSENTRHAQFVKAFSRRAVFSAEHSAECESLASSVPVQVPVPVPGHAGVCRADNVRRLERRAKALHRLLCEADALGVVDERGRRMFGLDVND